MERGTGLVLLSLGAFLFIATLTAHKPGLPPTLKADEPAYYLMALSLARDGDLLVEQRDLLRLQEEYPSHHVENLILMSRDHFRTIYYGKPYIYPLLAAPLARFFGANGLVALNMALFVAMVAMATSYLARFNPAPLAALFAGGFFFVSTAFAYVFWLQPEIFSMAGVMVSLWLTFTAPERSGAVSAAGWRRVITPLALRAAGAGAALALAAYNKPAFALMGLPAAWRLLGRRRWREATAWLTGFALSGGLVVAGSIALTGQASAYLGAARGGVSIVDAEKPPIRQVTVDPEKRSPTANTWSWIFALPKLKWSLPREAGYFLWGRHTGLFLYMPFAAVALLLFLLHGRRSGIRWATLAALAAVALFFLLWIPFNWFGGGGFVGNRYFVCVYPAFLFLVTQIRPVWILPAGCAAGALFLGTIVLSPFGPVVPQPTLQAHVRNAPFRWFPLELTHLRALPGYTATGFYGAFFTGRRDAFLAAGDEMRVVGGEPVEIWVQARQPLATAVFGVRSEAGENRVRLDLAGDAATLTFVPESPFQVVTLRPESPTATIGEGSNAILFYRLRLTAEHGRIPRDLLRQPGARFYLGASLGYYGTRDPRDSESYRATWGRVEAPAAVPAGASFLVRAELSNRSEEAWPASGVARVIVSYHWLSAAGDPVAFESPRTALPSNLAPGATVTLEIPVEAPAATGRHLLEIEPLVERMAWFSTRDPGAARRLEIDLLPAAAGQAGH